MSGAGGTGKNGFLQFITVASLVLNAVLVSRLLWGEQCIAAYREMQAKDEKIAAQIQKIDAENAALSQEIRMLRAEGIVLERAVRARLNFVKENEILYFFQDEPISKGGRP